MAGSYKPEVYKSKQKYQPDGVSERPEYRELYDGRWNRTSLLFRQRNPFCVVCGAPAYGHEKIETRTGRERNESLGVVDHIIPHRGDMKLFWNQANWQTLCNQCHGKKSAGER